MSNKERHGVGKVLVWKDVTSWSCMHCVLIICQGGDYCELRNPWILVTFPEFNGAKSFVTFLRPFLLLPQCKNPPFFFINLHMSCYNCRHMGCGNHMKMFVETYWTFYNFWNLSLLSSLTRKWSTNIPFYVLWPQALACNQSWGKQGKHCPILFFFWFFALGPTFGSLEEFGGASPFLHFPCISSAIWMKKLLGFKEMNFKQKWHLIPTLLSTTFSNFSDEELTFIWWLALQVFPWCHHLCLSIILVPTIHWRCCHVTTSRWICLCKLM